MRNAAVVLAVLIGLGGCSPPPPPPSVGGGLAREVVPAGGAVTSLGAARLVSATNRLLANPAVHIDYRVETRGRVSTGAVELDVGTGAFRTATTSRGAVSETIVTGEGEFRRNRDEVWVERVGASDLSVGRAMGFHPAVDLGLDELTDLAVAAEAEAEVLDPRFGADGFEEGHRFGLDEGSLEFWISRDTGALTVLSVRGVRGATGRIRYVPLPAPLSITVPTA